VAGGPCAAGVFVVDPFADVDQFPELVEVEPILRIDRRIGGTWFTDGQWYTEERLVYILHAIC
jgi:hypothetical protein